MTKLGDLSGLKKIYKENKTELYERLCELWGSKEAIIKGKCVEGKSSLLFVNCTALNGKKIKYPNGKNITIKVPKSISLKIGTNYRVKFMLAYDDIRAKLNNEYLIQIDTNYRPKEVRMKPVIRRRELSSEQKHIAEIKRDYESGSERLIKLSTNTIKSLVTETNKKPETFIFELIQNADDYPDPNREGVSIEFHIVRDYLIMVHNGLTFRENNVEAICGVNEGDKKMDLDKVGYKGMGFKSIFKFSNYVWINSGEYSFRFDELSSTKNNQTRPWQVIPIWTETKTKIPELQLLLKYPVTIIIKPNDGEEKLRELMTVFKSVFKKDSRLLLFLRNVNSIKFCGFGESFGIKKFSELWNVSDLSAVSLDDKTYSALRYDADNDDRVPEKYKNLKNTKISFAVAQENNQIKPLSNTRLFAYLPTDLDFGFSFLINGDFIPDGSRDKLFDDISFNLFLMRKAGYLFVEWVAKLIDEVKNTTPYLLIPDLDFLIENEHDRSKTIFLKEFKEGFVQALDEVKFLLCENGELELLSNIIIDKTGISGLLGTQKFKSHFNISKEALHAEVKDTIWIQKLIKTKEYEGLFNWDDLISGFLKIKEDLKSPEFNTKFLNLIAHKNKLEAFKDLSVVFNHNSELEKFNYLYKDVPDDHKSIISYLGASWVNPNVLIDLKEKVISGFKVFDGVAFIQTKIIANLNTVNKTIKTEDTSQQIFALIDYYKDDLPSNSLVTLKSLYFIDDNKKVIRGFHNQPNYFPHTFFEEIKLSRCFPEEHFTVVSPNYNLPGLFAKYFNVIDFDTSNFGDFLMRNVSGKVKEINVHLNSLDTINFVKASSYLLQLFLKAKEFLNDTQRQILISDYVKLNVLTKTGTRIPMSECYISGVYSGSSEVEELIEEFQIDVVFVSEKYAENSDLSKSRWNNLFIELGCKSDHLNFIKDTLLPKIGTLENNDLIKATKLIFKNRTSLEKELKEVKDFPVATSSGIFKSSEVVFNQKMYVLDESIMGLWGEFPLDNQIAEDYFDVYADQWVSFFQSLGVEAPTSDFPLTQIIEKVVAKNFEDEELHLKVVSLIFSLFKKEKLTRAVLFDLQSFKLLNDCGKYQAAKELVLSLSYKPKIDFKSYVKDEVSILSDKYLTICDNLFELKKFFLSIEVTDSFRVVFSKGMRRAGLPSWFVSYIDHKHSYIKSNALTYAHQHYIESSSDKGFNLIPHLDLISNTKLNDVFWKQIIEFNVFRKNAFLELKYRCAFNKIWRIPGYLGVYVSVFKSIPNEIGELCFGPELYSNKFKGIIKEESLICKLDFKDIVIVNRKLEDILGVKSDLDIEGIIKLLKQEESLHFLKQNKVIKKLNELIENRITDKYIELLTSFKEKGKLLNQLGEWISIKSLYRTDPNFEHGILNNRWLLHKDFQLIGELLNVRVLAESDFTFTKESYAAVPFFKERLISRFKYLAFIIDNENWIEKEDEYKTVIENVDFYQCKKITMAFNGDEVLIEKNDYDYIIHDEDFYFRGNWNGIRAASMFVKLASLIGLKNESQQVSFREIVLLGTITDILEYIEELGFDIPEDWKIKKEDKTERYNREETNEEVINEVYSNTVENKNENPLKESEIELIEDSEQEREIIYSSDEEELLKKLFGDSLSGSQKSDSNLEAHIKALNYYKNLGYDITDAEDNFHKNFPKRFLYPIIKDNVKLKVMCRSAVTGLLYFGAYAWDELSIINTELYMLLGNGYDDCRIAHDKSELKSEEADYWLLRRNIDLDNQKLDDLISSEKEKDQLQILFNVKKSAFSGVFLNWNKESNGLIDIKQGDLDEV